MESKKKLRHNEYYGQQELFDLLYSKSQKGHSFYKLTELMATEENIRLAYRNIKRNTGSKTKGVDGITIKDIERLPTEQIIRTIKLMFDYYIPKPVRRVWIDKSCGGKRPLGIPTIWDRLFQQCILQVLEPICEAKFYKHSYGFRPNRNTKHAISRMASLVNIYGYYHCVDVDIKGFFDNVNHGKLLKQMWTMGIKDKRFLSIISAMVKAEIKGEGYPNKGTPQGGILSPILSNIVLNELDWWVASQWEKFPAVIRYGNKKGQAYKKEEHKYELIRKNSKLKEIFIVRYADDFKILCKTAKNAKLASTAVKDFLLIRLGLECSEEKSKVINLKKHASEFLGIKLKATWKRKRSVEKYIKTKNGKTVNPKRTKITKREREENVNNYEYKELWSISSNMTNKAKRNAKSKIKEAIIKIQKNPGKRTVVNYNSVIHGIQNYYNMATNITYDLAEINFHSLQTLKNRLKDKWTDADKQLLDKHQKERYDTYQWSRKAIAKKVLSPIYAQKHVEVRNFSQDVCNFTVTGRKSIHRPLVKFNSTVLQYIRNSYNPKGSIEFNDNRITKFIAQNGKCAITKIQLGKHDWDCHHIVPFRKTSDDSFHNLRILVHDIHKLIRMTDPEKILRIIEEFSLKRSQIIQINALKKNEEKSPIIMGELRKKVAQKNKTPTRKLMDNSH
ncbi:reverse transcriptase domain-containing protein [Priestia endophytica]|uniref:reverse transcriptase domain-containing protein n=1 Tax=Priestia endophytica TaxID=135735 RepID=UPI00203BE2F0|nr:reverse transcriptase domain-containing protein [Priestia endophytica]MCM3537406.1 reverse transcriptase domain-containing protein [Priestia endophytica]